MRARTLLVLCLGIVLFSCEKNEAPERPKLPAIDPTDSTVGLGIRILTEGARLVDTSMPNASKKAFGITMDSIDVIKIDRGGSTDLALRVHKHDVRAKDVLMGWDGEKKYLVLPILKEDTINHYVHFRLALDSSIEPGIFQLTFGLLDTSGAVSKHLSKWVILRGKPVNIDSLIVGRWKIVRLIINGSRQDATGRFEHYDSKGRFGEWRELSYYGNNPWKGLLLAFENSLFGNESSPNWDHKYSIINDTLSFPGKSNYSYRILGLNSRKMLQRESDGLRESFWVEERKHDVDTVATQ
jgi:hypothetical protein